MDSNTFLFSISVPLHMCSRIRCIPKILSYHVQNDRNDRWYHVITSYSIHYTKLYDSNTILDGITIDEDAVRAGINRSDYVQIETTYLYLSTQSYDENQNAIELTEEETQSYLDIMQEALTMAQNGSSFADIKTALSDDDSYNFV